MPETQSSLIAELTGALDPARVLTAAEDVAVYGYDGTPVLRANPGCVVLPRTTAEVAACVRAARAHGVPVVARGSGTGLSGGSVPIAGCVVLCLVHMNSILEL